MVIYAILIDSESEPRQYAPDDGDLHLGQPLENEATIFISFA